MTWWIWMILGAVLLGAELFAVDAQFYLVFLGVSAALVGLASLFGIVMPEWMQWMAFAVLSLFFFFTFRKTLYTKLRTGGEVYPRSRRPWAHGISRHPMGCQKCRCTGDNGRYSRESRTG